MLPVILSRIRAFYEAHTQDQEQIMRMQSLTLAVGSALLLVAAPGMADHPSKNGEGWANMPNDIHNTRVETRESGDNESFREFVQYGEGADSVNRFASDDTQPDQANQKKGEAKETSNQGESQANNQTNNQTNNQANNQTSLIAVGREAAAVAGAAVTASRPRNYVPNSAPTV